MGFQISRRDEIREELQDLLTMALDDDQQMSTPEIVDEKPSQDRGSENEGIKGDSEDDDEIAQEKHEAQEEEDSREAKIENGKSDGRGDRDVTMDTENASQESRKGGIVSKIVVCMKNAFISGSVMYPRKFVA